LSELLKQDFDVLHVATPGPTHYELSMSGLQAGRNVFVEKPFTRTVAEVDQLVAEAKSQQVRIIVDHSLLGEPHFVKAKECIQSGDIGHVHSVHVFRCGAPPQRIPKRPPYPDLGDPMREVGIHALYCVSSMLGEIRDVRVLAPKTGFQTEFEVDEWSLNLECGRGFAHIQLTWNGPAHQVIRVHGDQGQLRIDLASGLLLRRRNWPGPQHVLPSVNPVIEATTILSQLCQRITGYVFGKSVSYQGIHNFIRTYYACLRAGDPMPVDHQSVRNIVEWTERVANSIEETRTTVVGSPKLAALSQGCSGAATTRPASDERPLIAPSM